MNQLWEISSSVKARGGRPSASRILASVESDSKPCQAVPPLPPISVRGLSPRYREIQRDAEGNTPVTRSSTPAITSGGATLKETKSIVLFGFRAPSIMPFGIL